MIALTHVRPPRPGPSVSPRLLALGSLALLALAFADAPLRTFGQRPRAHRWAERLVLLSIELNLLLLWAMAKLALRRDAPIAPESAAPVLAWAGMALAWLGAAFAAWAKLRLGRWFSASFQLKPGHALVTDGPYAVVRHPIYAGLLACALGLAVAWNSLLTLGLAVILAGPFALHAAVEEQMFTAHFGDAYRDYRRRVPALLPLPRRRG